MKLVGRSFVSALTHPPASGPDAPCTMPVMNPVAGVGPRCASSTPPGSMAKAMTSPVRPAHNVANPNRVRVDLLIRFLLKERLRASGFGPRASGHRVNFRLHPKPAAHSP